MLRSSLLFLAAGAGGSKPRPFSFDGVLFSAALHPPPPQWFEITASAVVRHCRLPQWFFAASEVVLCCSCALLPKCRSWWCCRQQKKVIFGHWRYGGDRKRFQSNRAGPCVPSPALGASCASIWRYLIQSIQSLVWTCMESKKYSASALHLILRCFCATILTPYHPQPLEPLTP